MNEIAVMGTHNSYQMLATLPKRALMRTLQIISFGVIENKAIFETHSPNSLKKVSEILKLTS